MKNKFKPAFQYILIFLSITTLVSCSKNQAEKVEPQSTDNDVTVENVTYNNFTGKLLETKCNSCHASGGTGTSKWTFSGYASVKSNADRINNAVLVTKTMPMGGSLSAKERELLDAWFKRNMPES